MNLNTGLDSGLNLDEFWCRVAESGPRSQMMLGSEFCDSEEYVRSEHSRRRTFIAHYGYAIPTRAALTAIAEFVEKRRIIEVCGGLGLWAALLERLSVDLAVTDRIIPAEYWCTLIGMGDAEESVRFHTDCMCLMMIWPPFSNDVAARALRAFSGDRLVYVGDARFTADAEFHAELAREWRVHDALALPSWPGIADYAVLLSR